MSSCGFRLKSKRACIRGNCINYDAMRRIAPTLLLAGVVCFQSGTLRGQSTLQTLQDELNAAKQAHQDVTAQTLANFFGQIDPAMASPDAAVALFEQAGGALPDPSPVITQNENETETEKETRLALDQANLHRIGTALQLQCGMMHFAALFVVKPDQAGLQDQWVGWLQSAAKTYPQLAVPDGAAQPPPEKKKKHKDDDVPPAPKPPPPPFNPSSVMYKAMKDTEITKFLAFTAWGDKEQGGWSVKDLPRLFRASVLEPLRAKPTDATLAAWDAYIGMANADEKDNDRWNQVVLPPLRFDRSCDAYAVEPSTEKLEGLVNLIKASPTNPHADEWIARVSQLMDAYRAGHGGTPTNAPSPTSTPIAAPSPANPNVTVTTVQQGDATIITTHTNSAPVAPTP
jgi:hypothetical protein